MIVLFFYQFIESIKFLTFVFFFVIGSQVRHIETIEKVLKQCNELEKFRIDILLWTLEIVFTCFTLNEEAM